MILLYQILLGLGAYLLGSLSPSVFISGKSWGIDIRNHASKNAGTTNMLRVMGWRYGLMTFAADVAKGVIPVLVGQWTGLPWGAYIGAVGALAGHAYPLFSGFKGGKCVATAIGVLLAMAPGFVGIALAIGLVVVFIVRIVSLTVLLGFSLATIVSFFMPGLPQGFSWLVLGITILLFFRHRQNIVRMFKGEEKRLVVSKGKKPAGS